MDRRCASTSSMLVNEVSEASVTAVGGSSVIGTAKAMAILLGKGGV